MTSTLSCVILYGKNFKELDCFNINPNLKLDFGRGHWQTPPDPFDKITVVEFLQHGNIKCKADTEEFLILSENALRYLVGAHTKIRRKMAWQKTRDILPLPGQVVVFSDGVSEAATNHVEIKVANSGFDQRQFSVSLRNNLQLSKFPYWMNCSFAP